MGIDTSSTFKSTSVDFEFGVPFLETTGDGTKVETTATLTGNTLTKDQVVVKLINLGNSKLYLRKLIVDPPESSDIKRSVSD